MFSFEISYLWQVACRPWSNRLSKRSRASAQDADVIYTRGNYYRNVKESRIGIGRWVRAGIHTKKLGGRLNLTETLRLTQTDCIYILRRNFPPRYAEKAIKTDFSQGGLSLLNQPQEYVKRDNAVSRTQCLFYYEGCLKTVESVLSLILWLIWNWKRYPSLISV